MTRQWAALSPHRPRCAALHEVSRAVENARRMREASRALITGNTALGICLIESLLVVVHADLFDNAAPFVMAGLVAGYLAVSIVSLRWMFRRRKQELVTVVDRREEAARTAAARPWRAAIVISAALIFQGVCIFFWGIALRHMSNGAILACVSIGPLFGALYFVHRFAIYRFWEDLLFAASVTLAYVPFLVQDGRLTPLCFLALFLVIFGAASLDRRWTIWTHSLVAEGGEDLAEGVRP